VSDVWVVKGLLFLLLLFVLVYFFLDNSGQTVDIKLFGREYLDISIFWILVLAYLLGFATSFVLAAIREFRFHRRIRHLKGDLQTKDREIADLRTLPLQDISDFREDEESDRG
jgi:uncharacterized integral membrane protein